jgi:hypothetical protein
VGAPSVHFFGGAEEFDGDATERDGAEERKGSNGDAAATFALVVAPLGLYGEW